MESLFKLSDLETRVSLNMNVLDRGAPRVMSLPQVLKAFLAHVREMTLRRARWRLGKIEARLHLLDGFLIAYLNIDEVIRIIREEDEPKQVMMARFDLSDIQAEAILNMRLRALRKLEEIEIRKEHADLTAEKADLEGLLADERRQWATVSEKLLAARKALGPDNPFGRRLTRFGEAPEVDAAAALEAMTVKEPITLILTEKGWLRAMKGHGVDVASVRVKDGDAVLFAVEGQTTDRFILMASDGRAFTLAGDRLPGGRGTGEPLRLSIELPEDADILAAFVYDESRKRVMASSGGYGFVVPEAELLSQKRGGKAVLNVADGRFLACPVVAGEDHVAVVGDNRKLLLFPLAELPEMPRGKGVKLQNYKDGGLADIAVFRQAEGFAWTDAGGRNRALEDWALYVGKRASAGRMVPKGFPKSGRFSP